ncbi:MAG: type II toxin-antitoxin system Phd/YefM family antitoxin [Planctomycetes bacterium]|nr:type II toxin-antitoxin system Phd/YefM family antitoxin [Planctomycetota bacterium]
MTPLRPPSRVPLRRFRADLAGTLRRVATDGEYVVLTRRGVVVAAIVPPGALEMLAAADALFAGRARAASADLHDLATAAPDATPSPRDGDGPDRGQWRGRGQRPTVPRRG